MSSVKWGMKGKVVGGGRREKEMLVFLTRWPVGVDVLPGKKGMRVVGRGDGGVEVVRFEVAGEGPQSTKVAEMEAS